MNSRVSVLVTFICNHFIPPASQLRGRLGFRRLLLIYMYILIRSDMQVVTHLLTSIAVETDLGNIYIARG